MRMTWFWRIVCSPGCTDACQSFCPGCKELSEEWKQLGVAPTECLPRNPFAIRRLKLRWKYWYRLLRAMRAKTKREALAHFEKAGLVPAAGAADACCPDGCGCAEEPAEQMIALPKRIERVPVEPSVEATEPTVRVQKLGG